MLLQGGRHVADVGVLYPIATLPAGYHFGAGRARDGGVIPPEADYMTVGELLSLELHCDFTYLHPEVLADRCSVVRRGLQLDNEVNRDLYSVIVIPGSRTIHPRSLQRIEEFFNRGGRVIATTCLPQKSAEPGRDEENRQAVRRIFGLDPAVLYPVTTGSGDEANPAHPWPPTTIRTPVGRSPRIRTAGNGSRSTSGHPVASSG